MKDGYHVLLGAPTVIRITVDVPAAFGISFTDFKSGVLEAAIDADWLFNLNIQVTQSHGIPPTTLPIHLFSQVLAVFGQGGSWGFHYLFATSSGATLAAPFIQAGYLSKALVDPNGRSQAANTGVLAHEVAEWLIDPTVSNVTMPWQDPAHLGVCTNPLLETADPLEAIAPGLDVGGYRFPDVALLPWFTGSQVLRSDKQQYSLFGGLTSRSSVCPNYVNFRGVTLGIIGADATVFTGINNQHQVVGFFTVGNALGSFILSNVDPIAGTAITGSSVYVPGSLFTVAQGVNDAGNVVGFYVDSQGQERGFLLQGSLYIPIDFPGAVATEALGTNKHGDIVGNYTDSAGATHGFAFMNARFHAVDAPFASRLSVTGINDSRIVAGTYSSGSTTASFSGPLGNLQPFNFPQVSPLDLANFPATFATFANGLNNSQEIVGSVRVNGNPDLAYLATKGLIQSVSLPAADFDGAQSSQLNGVNNSGAVVGTFTDHNGTFGVVLLPGTDFGLPFQRITIAAP